MKNKLLGILSLICLALTATWLVLLIWDAAGAGPVEPFEQVVAHVARQGWTFYVTYLNAALITVSATVLFAGLYGYCKPAAPDWALIGLIFVPVYCTLNLFAYLSQVAVVPDLLARSDSDPMAMTVLRLLLQAWPGSAVSFFNNLAYAILGIPSVVFGALLYKQDRALRLGAVLLALNGVACVVGVAGILMGNDVLSLGSVVGGGLYLLALVPMSWVFLRTV